MIDIRLGRGGCAIVALLTVVVGCDQTPKIDTSKDVVEGRGSLVDVDQKVFREVPVGQPCTFSIPIRNMGPADVFLSAVEPGCSCMVAPVPPEGIRIPAGETISVAVMVKASTVAGVNSKQVRLLFSDGAIRNVNCSVKVQSNFRAMPNSLILKPSLTAVGEASAAVSFTNSFTELVSMSAVLEGVPDVLLDDVPAILKLEPGATAVIRVTCANDLVTATTGRLRLAFDNGPETAVFLPVTILPENGLAISTKALHLGLVDDASLARRVDVLRVFRPPNSPWVIHSAVAPDCLNVEIDDEQSEIRLNYDPTLIGHASNRIRLAVNLRFYNSELETFGVASVYVHGILFRRGPSEESLQ